MKVLQVPHLAQLPRLLTTSLLLACMLVTVRSRDASYAAELQVPLRENTTIVQRLVSLGWLRYMQANFRPHEPKSVWFTVKSVPKTWQGEEVTSDTRERVAREIKQVASDVLDEYLRRVFYLQPDKIDIRDGIDTKNITFDALPSAQSEFLRNVQFNRTIVISFEDPPYGQSKPQRLVTNRNIQWHDDDYKRRTRTKDFTRIDVSDLRYRYYHNIGHALGFGHFVDLLDASMSETDKQYQSVMFADVNSPHASQTLTEYDVFSMYYIAHNLDHVLLDFAKRMIEKEIPANVVNVNRDYARFLLS